MGNFKTKGGPWSQVTVYATLGDAVKPVFKIYGGEYLLHRVELGDEAADLLKELLIEGLGTGRRKMA